MAFAIFGPGSLYITRTDILNATPINIGYAQEFSLDESAETKELFGQDQYPLVVARGTIKVTGKAKAAELSAIAVNNAFHGESGFSVGQILFAPAEAHTIPTTPYEVTVTHNADFNSDLGVVYAATGLPFIKVAGPTPSAGQYVVDPATGIYTFAAADTTIAVLITYAYDAASGGQIVTVTNKLIGNTPTFQLDYATSLNNNPYYLRLFQCVSSKLSQSFKLTDFSMPEIDFSIFANPSGQVYSASYPQVG